MSRIQSCSLRPGGVGVMAIAWFALAAACGATLLRAQRAPRAAEPVVREVLVSASPHAAPSQQLQLVRYVIQPGTTLPPHTHPGVQIGWIESGTLHYVVVEGGETPIYRRAVAGRPAPAETVRPGQETDLHPGDSLVETERVIHYGANREDHAVVIWCATLLREGQPAATVAETRAP